MRLILAATAILLAVGTTDRASAVEYPWCAVYGEPMGAKNCGFSTLAQCRAAISGNGGYCEANPFYTGPRGRR